METADILAALTPPDGGRAWVNAALLIVIGLGLGLVVRSATERFVGRVSTPERATLARRVVFMVCLVLGGASALHTLGVDLTLFLGSAGVFSVAIGFASQTSASNIISGLFLILERPFSVGDVVQIGAHVGEVRSVDFLSTSIRTFDNLYLRLPNEMVMKSEITNLTRFAIRRFELLVRVPLDADHARVRDVLQTALVEVQPILDEPKPLVRFVDFQDFGAVFKVLAWSERSALFDARDQAAAACQVPLAQAGIEIPAGRLR
jgi:small-conductance mechanosensitive channel